MSQKFGDLAPSDYPGERLGLPERGTGSVARAGRRLLALLIDWALAAVPAYVLIGGENAMWWHLVTFVVLQALFIPTIGGSIGHRLTGLHVVPIAGGWIGIWRPVVRSILIIAVIPPLVWDSDQRGFHDKIAGTVLIRS
ncbi:MAG: RDD family protein [Leucobacter sp.]